MWLKNNISIGEAIDQKIVILGKWYVFSHNFRVVSTEDDGKNYGVIFIGKTQ